MRKTPAPDRSPNIACYKHFGGIHRGYPEFLLLSPTCLCQMLKVKGGIWSVIFSSPAVPALYSSICSIPHVSPATPFPLTLFTQVCRHLGPRAKLAPCHGVFPLLHYAYPSLRPKNLPGDGISLRPQAFPALLMPAAARHVGRRQSDLSDAGLVRALPFQGAQAAASGSQGARGEGLGHGWQGHGHLCSKNHRNM